MIEPKVIKKAIAEIKKRPANYQYFFDNLKSPEWIKPLFEEGMFQDPPQPEREEDSIGFPFWPESEYLVRMSSISPEIVFEIISKIPVTDNFRVHQDFATAAQSMPPTLAAKLAIKEAAWIKSQNHLYLVLPGYYGNLISHLSNGGQIETALRFTKVLLEVLPDKRPSRQLEDPKPFYLPPEPHARFDYWHYEKILKNNIPDLLRAAGIDAFVMLCDLLETSERLSRRKHNERGPEDYSYTWRPAIEGHNQNRSKDIKDALVTAVRDAAEAVGKSEQRDVLEILERRPFKIFHRIALHLRRVRPAIDPKGTSKLILNPNLFDDITSHHEYFHLLQDHFGSFSKKTQNAYLAMVTKAESAKESLKLRNKEMEKPPNEKEKEQYIRRWKYKKIIPIKKFLNRDWQKKFSNFEKKFGILSTPDFKFTVGATWIGPTSPKNLDELKQMDPDGLISYLKTWKPNTDHKRPSPEGLGRILSNLISNEPKKFAKLARWFQELEPTYVRAYIWGLREAINKGGKFQWPPVLDLCLWVIKNPREFSDIDFIYNDRDPDWGWARKTAADLIELGLKSNVAEIPFRHRKKVWAVLKPLTNDPDPTPEEDARWLKSDNSANSLAINTVRGRAMQAVVYYGLWVKRNLEKDKKQAKYSIKGFEKMPEVREILDKHLVIEQDPSPAIRSIYGQWLPWLANLDLEWTSENIAKIFPENDGQQILYEAAWNAYITLCDPYTQMLPLLKKQYLRAVNRIEKTSKEKNRIADPEECLTMHLMNWYWQGLLDLMDAEGLLTKFYKNAPLTLRKTVFDFIGRSLTNTKGKVPIKVVKRLKFLFQYRIDKIHDSEHSESKSELEGFGLWFASGKFDNAWSVRQLQEVLKMKVQVESGHLVIKRLTKLKGKMPLEVLKCLGLMIKSDTKGWRVGGWREGIHTILSATLKNSDKKVLSASSDLIHQIGTLGPGYSDFRELLKK